MSRPEDNVVYIDEFRRERWLLKLRLARETGEIAVFHSQQDGLATVIPFPERPEPDPEDAA